MSPSVRPRNRHWWARPSDRSCIASPETGSRLNRESGARIYISVVYVRMLYPMARQVPPQTARMTPCGFPGGMTNETDPSDQSSRSARRGSRRGSSDHRSSPCARGAEVQAAQREAEHRRRGDRRDGQRRHSQLCQREHRRAVRRRSAGGGPKRPALSARPSSTAISARCSKRRRRSTRWSAQRPITTMPSSR